MSRRYAMTLRRHGLYLGALITPLAIWLFLRAVPKLDMEYLAGDFHLVIMTAVSICSIGIAALAARAATSLKQPGIVLLAAGCLGIGLLLLGHGLTTPFVLGQPLNQWVARLPYLGLTFFAVCLSLAASPWSKQRLGFVGRYPAVVLSLVSAPILALVIVVSAWPTALSGTAAVSGEEALRNAAACGTMAMLLPVSWVHWRRFRLSLDIVQASLAVAAAMTAAAVLSMHLGTLWRLSWWDYHGCLLAGFAGVAYAIFKRWGSTRTAATVLEYAFEHDPLTLIAQNYPAPLRRLVDTMEKKDQYTHGHSARTATLAVSIGVRMGLGSDDLRVLAQGTYLHDIGKLGIPDEILNKPAGLTVDERTIINTHPILGCDLASAHDILEPCLPIIRHHHERYDGAGYPAGLRGEEIPLLARIAAVADVWDALTTHRSYRPGWSPQRALDHIVDGAGTHLDPRIVAVLLGIASDMGILPSGLAGHPGVLTSATADCHETMGSQGDLSNAIRSDLHDARITMSPDKRTRQRTTGSRFN